MEKLIEYYIRESDKKFEELKGEIHGVKDRLDDLNTFRVGMIAQARLTSLIVSAFCGLLTLLLSVWVAFHK